MSEILSQAEIDELLSALKSGEMEDAPEKGRAERDGARMYDFRTANRFTKDQMRSLAVIFQSYAQLFANRVTSVLRIVCDCAVLSVEELGYSEFNNSLPSPVILGIFTAAPMSGSQILQISPEVAYMIINRLLGGVQASKESGKQFTEIELALIERFFGKIMHTFDEAWEKVLPIRSKLDRLETNTQFVQVAGLNDAVAVGTMSLKIGGDEGLFSLCLPRSSIEAIAGSLSTRMMYTAGMGSERVHDEGRSQMIGEKLSGTRVSLVAHFRSTPATVSDIVNLQIGDVIRLAHRTQEPLMMRVEHIPKFLGNVGISESQYALRITDVVEEGAEEDESFTGRN
ncbi:MAG: flagellar motor switch protein FliM [Clostridiales bacterium]|nr:flagellar motor switch protein FliM [Clostridiales bacterium]